MNAFRIFICMNDVCLCVRMCVERTCEREVVWMRVDAFCIFLERINVDIVENWFPYENKSTSEHTHTCRHGDKYIL